MSPTDPQAISITSFLATSRSYLGLPERRRVARPAAPLRWLRLALLAGSVGSLFGGLAMAEHGDRSARTPGGKTQIATFERQSRNRIERMP